MSDAVLSPEDALLEAQAQALYLGVLVVGLLDLENLAAVADAMEWKWRLEQGEWPKWLTETVLTATKVPPPSP